MEQESFDIASLEGFRADLVANHSTLDGFVCLWRDGELSAEWETVDGLFSRIEDWCRRAKGVPRWIHWTGSEGGPGN